MKLGQARGAAISAVVTLDLPVFEYTPAAVKQGLVGNGRAEKEQVQHMVRVILGMQGRLVLDESDALAVALCHLSMQGPLAAAVAGGRSRKRPDRGTGRR